jgi:hypothetical protein
MRPHKEQRRVDHAFPSSRLALQSCQRRGAGASSISINWRRAKSERIADYKTHSRRAIRVSVSDLIPGAYDTK